MLGVELPWLENITRAKRPPRLPVVLIREKTRAVLARLDGVVWLNRGGRGVLSPLDR